MLTESNDLNLRSADESTTDASCIDQLQSELDQFISTTMNRLDEVAVALREYGREEQAQQEILDTCANSNAPEVFPEGQASDMDEPLLSDLHRSADEVTDSGNEAFQEPLDQDESMTRLNAIKLRIAKQLERN